MKDFFYTFAVIIFILIMWDISKHPQRHDLHDIKNVVVIDKDDDFIDGKTLQVKYKNDSIIKIRCYGIVWEKYKVGDTIK